jgi:hypothetical protein
MRHKTVVVILIGLLCFGLFQVYDSPDENHKYEDDLQGTIRKGHSFSWLLFMGNKHQLLDQFDFIEEARSKLNKANVQEVSGIEILDKYKDGGGRYENELRSILFTESKDIELVVLERQRNYIAMTFKFNKKFTESPDIPGKGRMLYSVVFRYYEPDGALWEKMLRKTANAVPFFSSFGTTGKWLVVDYSYTYNKADYATWYLREGDSFVSQKQKENMNSLKGLATKEGIKAILDRVEANMAISDVWAEAWVKRHPEHVDEQLFQKMKRFRDEIVPEAR